MQPIYLLVDKANEYLPYGLFFRFSKRDFLALIIVLISVWVFIYYIKIFRYNTSIMGGFLTGLFFLLSLYYLDYAPTRIFLNRTTDQWELYNVKTETVSTYMVDLDKYIKINKIDRLKYGLIVDKKFIDDNNIKLIPFSANIEKVDEACEKAGHGEENKKECRVRRHRALDGLGEKLNYRAKSIGQQSYVLLNIAFTMGLVVWSASPLLHKSLILPLFKYAFIPSACLTFLMQILFEANDDKNEWKFKIVAFYISLTVLTGTFFELLRYYSKKKIIINI